MTQIAQVKELIPGGLARVGVQRQSACAHDCSKCSGCGHLAARQEVVVTAENHVGAGPGDIVLVESGSRGILAAAAAVYLAPLLLFFLGYFAGMAAQLGGGLCAALGGLGFAVGILSARRVDARARSKNTLRFHIVEIKQACSDI